MRALIILAAVVLLMALIGWVTFSRGPGESSINLETDQIKSDTQEAMESGAKMLDEAEDAITRPEADEETSEPPAEPASPEVESASPETDAATTESTSPAAPEAQQPEAETPPRTTPAQQPQTSPTP